jgi:Putative Actinobacterial Holin-X, holin superfamily III
MERTTSSRSRWMDLIGGILFDVKSLLRQEVQLFKDEVKLEISTAGRAATKFLIGAALGIVGALFLLLMLVHGLHEWTVLPLWACYGLVGGALTALGLAFLVRAQSMAGRVQAVPRRTLYSMKENIQWIKEHMMLKRT